MINEIDMKYLRRCVELARLHWRQGMSPSVRSWSLRTEMF